MLTQVGKVAKAVTALLVFAAASKVDLTSVVGDIEVVIEAVAAAIAVWAVPNSK